MRISIIVLLIILAFSCKQSSKLQNPQRLQLTWGVIDNNYNNGSQFLSELRIINNSHQPLSENWELYFSYSPCRKVDTGSIVNTLVLTHINGDLHKINPTSGYLPLQPKDTLSIKIIASDGVIKESGAPNGFYFVFDGLSVSVVQPEYSITPFTSPNQLYRHANDRIEIPNGENIFYKNERLKLLPNESVGKITPTPSFIEFKEDSFSLNQNTQIVADSSLSNEVDQLKAGIKTFTGLELNSSAIKNNTDNYILLTKSSLGADKEYYELIVTDAGIEIIGNSNAAVFYGIQSLKSLLPIRSSQKEEVQIPYVLIRDNPRFSYRGMHLDASRNFQSKASVLKLLEIMSFYKLNKFHFHLTDDEAWRLEIDGLPELTDVGAKRTHTMDEQEGLIHQYGSAGSNSGSGYYSKNDFIEILRFAKERHIEVIPEIDMPGHARAAIVAMKARQRKYASNPSKANQYILHDEGDQSIYSSVQNFNDNVVCPCQSSTFNFLEKVINEIEKMYKVANAPLTTIHTGGDEVPHGVWENAPKCMKLISTPNNGIDNIQDIKTHFLKNFSAIISNKGLKTAGWEEIGLTLEKSGDQPVETKTVNPDFLDDNFQTYVWNSVYGWGGEEIGYKLANAGYKVVLSNVTHLYFDMAYDKNPQEPGFYWGGFSTDEKPYQFQPFNLYGSLTTDLNGDPIPKEKLATKTKLTEFGRSNILGIQGQLWSETVKSAERLEYMVFPRLLSLAERSWASTPDWVNNFDLYTEKWNEFANRLGQRELKRMDYWLGGINYHIPTPGGIIKNDTLYANIALPGIQIRYSTNGKEPTSDSPIYTEPISVESSVILKGFDTKGRSGLPMTAEKKPVKIEKF